MSLSLSEARFQGVGIASAKALGWEHVWHAGVGGMAKSQYGWRTVSKVGDGGR